jgi:hypothetical protein
MNLKSLQHWVNEVEEEQQHQQSEESPAMQELIQKCRGLPFYRWTGFTKSSLAKEQHDSTPTIKWIPNRSNRYKNSCCFNHYITLPKKGNRYHPLYDYEKVLFDCLEKPGYMNSSPALNDYEHPEPLYPQKVGRLALVKSTGIGATEFFIRYIVWKCVVNDDLKGSDICIITGPREQLSIDILNRIRQLLLPLGITFDTKQTTLFINGVRIRSYPSNRLQDMRGLPNVSIIYCDEAAFFGPESQSQVLDVCERYAGKSQAKIIFCSTPNKVGDLMHQIISQPWDKSFYKVVKLDYTYSIGKLYSEQDILIAKASASFEREYNLSFISGAGGNVFGQKFIDRAIELGNRYPVTINKEAQHSLGIDPGFSSSSFGLVCLEHSDGIIKVVYADQFAKSSFNSMVQKVWEIRNLVGSLDNVYCDAVNVEYIAAIKQELGEDSDWHRIHDKLAWARKEGLDVSRYMLVVPVSFSQEGPALLVHAKNLLEHEDNLVAIHEQWTDLIAALRGAIAREYQLDKSQSPNNDLTDAFRLACKFFRLEK